MGKTNLNVVRYLSSASVDAVPSHDSIAESDLDGLIDIQMVSLYPDSQSDTIESVLLISQMSNFAD